MAPRRVPPHILKADSYIHPMTGGTSESAYAHTESRLLHPMTGGTAKNAYAHTESRLFFTWDSGPHCWHSRPQCWHSRPQEGELGAYNICFCFCLLDRQNVFTDDKWHLEDCLRTYRKQTLPHPMTGGTTENAYAQVESTLLYTR